MRQWDRRMGLAAYRLPLSAFFPPGAVILSESEGSRYKTLVTLLLLNAGQREDEEMVNGKW